jgi:hypothetical protein
MKWHWPTEEGWLMIVALTVTAWLAHGLIGLLVMLGFFVAVNVLGNWLLP